MLEQIEQTKVQVGDRTLEQIRKSIEKVELVLPKATLDNPFPSSTPGEKYALHRLKQLLVEILR